MEPDYFPLEEGLRHEYRVSDADGEGRLSVELLSVERRGAELRALRRSVFVRGGRSETSEHELVKDGKGVLAAGERLLALPLAAGRSWTSPPREFSVESVRELVVVPAGVYHGCAKVVYLIAAGDGGGGERWYAPGVGLVKESCRAEDDAFDWELLRVGYL